jgi:hypothetical protein
MYSPSPETRTQKLAAIQTYAPRVTEAVPCVSAPTHVRQKSLSQLVVSMFDIETTICGAVLLAWGLFQDRAVERHRPPTQSP